MDRVAKINKTKLIVSSSFCTCKGTSVQVTIRYCTSTFTKNVATNLSLA